MKLPKGYILVTDGDCMGKNHPRVVNIDHIIYARPRQGGYGCMLWLNGGAVLTVDESLSEVLQRIGDSQEAREAKS